MELEVLEKERKKMNERTKLDANDDLFGRPTIGDLFPDFNPPTQHTKEKENEDGDKEAE